MILGGWFFVTPIVYPLDLVPDRYLPLLELNPLTSLVGLYRQALLGGDLRLAPAVAWLVLFSLLLCAAGLCDLPPPAGHLRGRGVSALGWNSFFWRESPVVMHPS